jgi:hypothetical protein
LKHKAIKGLNSWPWFVDNTDKFVKYYDEFIDLCKQDQHYSFNEFLKKKGILKTETDETNE